MTALEQERALIVAEITSDASEVRSQYMKEFQGEVVIFVEAMARAMLEWRAIDGAVTGSERKAFVAAISYAAMTLHTASMKLFLSGQIVHAGNATRQVIECIAMAILCSAKDLTVLSRFMEDKYSTSDAVRDVIRQARNLNLKEDGLAVLKSSQEFYHRYSHLTRITLATMLSFSKDGIYVGANFDAGKIEAYRIEVAERVSLAKVLPNILQGVRTQLSAWPTP